jgi:molybdate transport system regulatory protein
MRAKTIAFDEVLGAGSSDKRLEVLRSVHQAGSISQAARLNGVSYKAAWQAVETLSNLAGVPLIEKVVGGSGGGGARLTAQGLALLRAADLLQAARTQALAKLQRSTRGSPINVTGLAAVGLRTSMRNNLPCTVQEVRLSQGGARVLLALADGQVLASRITLESLQLLGLAPGMAALAMFKATAVTVAPRILALAGINLLNGKVARRSGGSGAAEVSLQLAPGLALVGFAEPDGGLKLRQLAMAAIEESAVVIGLAT